MLLRISYIHLVVAFLASSISLHAQEVTRGPILESPAVDGVTVSWETDIPTTGKVYYGIGSNLSSINSSQGTATKHSVRLNGLTPDRYYSYAIAVNEQSQPTQLFRTGATGQADTNMLVIAIGDAGKAGNIVTRVRDSLLDALGPRIPSLLFSLGDNAYNCGTDAEYGTFIDHWSPFFNKTPTVLLRGNHDGFYCGNSEDFYPIVHNPSAGESGGVPSGSEEYFTVENNGALFFVLPGNPALLQEGSPLFDWLGLEARRIRGLANPPRWTGVLTHYPPYSRGSHNSDTETPMINTRKILKKIVVDFEIPVNFTLSGHSHSYERSYPIAGELCYEKTTDLTQQQLQDCLLLANVDSSSGNDVITTRGDSTVHIVAGASSKVSSSNLDHEFMKEEMSVPGSLIMFFQNERLYFYYLDDYGAVRDHFSLTH